MSGWQAVVTILGLAAITLLTRSAFLLPREELPLPSWLQRGLKYAPLAALAAVIAPEIVLSDGRLIDDLRDARLPAAIAAAACYFGTRNILWTIVAGMAVFLPLRIGLGW